MCSSPDLTFMMFPFFRYVSLRSALMQVLGDQLCYAVFTVRCVSLCLRSLSCVSFLLSHLSVSLCSSKGLNIPPKFTEFLEPFSSSPHSKNFKCLRICWLVNTCANLTGNVDKRYARLSKCIVLLTVICLFFFTPHSCRNGLKDHEYFRVSF